MRSRFPAAPPPSAHGQSVDGHTCPVATPLDTPRRHSVSDDEATGSARASRSTARAKRR
ncbi:hypothetical protein C7S17_5938 [Burkholderia thailandensis]|nr:hypothetical protein [Burkholderia thailandensis]